MGLSHFSTVVWAWDLVIFQQKFGHFGFQWIQKLGTWSFFNKSLGTLDCSGSKVCGPGLEELGGGVEEKPPPSPPPKKKIVKK